MEYSKKLINEKENGRELCVTCLEYGGSILALAIKNKNGTYQRIGENDFPAHMKEIHGFIEDLCDDAISRVDIKKVNMLLMIPGILLDKDAAAVLRKAEEFGRDTVEFTLW